MGLAGFDVVALIYTETKCDFHGQLWWSLVKKDSHEDYNGVHNINLINLFLDTVFNFSLFAPRAEGPRGSTNLTVESLHIHFLLQGSLEGETWGMLTNKRNITLGSLHINFLLQGSLDGASWGNLTNQRNIT